MSERPLHVQSQQPLPELPTGVLDAVATLAGALGAALPQAAPGHTPEALRSVEGPAPQAGISDDPLWFQKAVFYEVWVRS